MLSNSGITFRLGELRCPPQASFMIVLISGTNRPDSNTRRITGEIAAQYQALHVPHRILDLAELPLEVFAPASYAEKPASFQPFSDAILAAAGLHVVTPEYNGGLPGVLKYFIDLLKFPESFERRPVAFTGLAAGMGALRPVEQLQAIFGYRNAHLYPERVFLPGIGSALGEDGHLKEAELIARLHKQAAGFTAFVETLKGVSLRA